MLRFLLSSAFILVASFVFAADHTKDTPEQVKKAVAEKKAILIDVREKKEWDAGHLQDALFLPLSSLKEGLPESAKSKLKKDVPLYLHCGSGIRCLKAADALKGLGYDIRPLKQGYQDLLDAGFKKAESK